MWAKNGTRRARRTSAREYFSVFCVLCSAFAFGGCGGCVGCACTRCLSFLSPHVRSPLSVFCIVPVGEREADRLLVFSLVFTCRIAPSSATHLITTMMCAVRWGHICGVRCAMRGARSNRNIEPSLAKAVAEGDACPISLLPMEDINPGYVPRALKPIPMNRDGAALTATATGVGRPDKGKGRAKEHRPEKPGLLKFFGKSALPSLVSGPSFGLAGVLTGRVSVHVPPVVVVVFPHHYPSPLPAARSSGTLRVGIMPP